MRDQAERLREIINNLKVQEIESQKQKQHTCKVITVTSGKGGVGKTNISANLSISLAKKGYRVLILDADLGLSNIEILFGISPKYTLLDVVNKEKRIVDIIATGPMNVKFISGGSGIEQLVNLEKEDLGILVDEVASLDTIADIIIIDTGAGISKNVIDFIIASDEVILVTTPDPTSLTDAYALVKTVSFKEKNKKINLIVNRADTEKEALSTISKLCFTTEAFLTVKLKTLGYILYDENIVRSVKQQEPFVLSYPKSLSAKQINDIAQKLLYIDNDTNNDANNDANKNISGIKGFFKKLLSFNCIG